MPVWMVVPSPHAHLAGTLLPRGFFLGLGLIDLAALAVDRLAARWSLPGAAAVLLLGNAHGDHLALHAAVASRLPAQLGALGLHLIAGAAAGLLVGLLAPRLVDALVRADRNLLLLTVALAFVAYGLGQWFGGGGLLAVFIAGLCLSNGRYRKVVLVQSRG